jgi:hypothetical protein
MFQEDRDLNICHLEDGDCNTELKCWYIRLSAIYRENGIIPFKSVIFTAISLRTSDFI